MAKFIAIMSGKGGVGKTTSAVNLGLAMHKLGSEVVVLDGNLSAPNLSIHLGNTYFPVTIHDVMQNREQITSAIYQHKTGLKIIPADVAVDSMKLVNFDNLRKHLQDLHLTHEYIIIDGSPGLGRETTSLLNLSDEVLLVSNTDRVSVLDAARMLEMSRKLGKTIAGLVITKFKKDRNTMSLKEIEQYLGLPVIAIIPHDDRFAESLNSKIPFIHLHPNREASKAYHKLAQIITGKVHL